jgi:AcrR family transcriptional regulator
MTSQKTDRRARYTQSVIKEAFVKLYRKNPIGKITVTDICKIAEINRGTFYLHYHDPYDLLERITDDYCDRVISHISTTMPTDSEPIQGMDIARYTHEMIDADETLGILVSTQPSSGNMMQKLFEGMASVLHPILMKRYSFTELEAQAVYTFLFSGFSATYNFFLNKKLKPNDTEKVNKIINNIVRDGIKGHMAM